MYKRQSYNDGIEGESASSNSVSVGDALLPPYSQDFTEKNFLGLFTVVDVNNDNKTWTYSNGTVRYAYHMKNNADDWLITPPLKLKKGYMYEFVTHTWNPIKGKCSHGCTYCYMKKMCSRLNTPRLDAAELTCYLECSNFIFVGSSIDMWAEDIPSHWIKMVLDYCDRSANKYLFQSKNPSRILDFITHPVFHHSVICTTIETNRFYPEIMRNSPKIEERVRAMEKIANLGINTYVTTEPLMQFDLDKMVEYIKRCKPLQVNIGRNTNRKVQLPEPTANEAKVLVTELEKFT